MKTICIYHSIDLDGWMSAAIVKHYWKDTINWAGDTLDFIGYNYGQPIPDLSQYGKVIMCDISFPKEEMIKIWDKLGVDNIVWIDHHISAIKDIQDTKWLWTGRQDTKYAACELTWKYFFHNEPMPEIVRLLGRYDCFGHKGTDEEQKVLEFQYGARNVIVGYEQCYNLLNSWSNHREIHNNQVNQMWLNGQTIYQYLCTDAKQAYANGFVIEFKETGVGTTNKFDGVYTYRFICINKERFNPINFGIKYHSEGYDGVACFHYNGKHWCFSLYNDNGEVDCSTIAKQYGGGGHKGAAGFIINDIKQIIK